MERIAGRVCWRGGSGLWYHWAWGGACGACARCWSFRAQIMSPHMPLVQSVLLWKVHSVFPADSEMYYIKANPTQAQVIGDSVSPGWLCAAQFCHKVLLHETMPFVGRPSTRGHPLPTLTAWSIQAWLPFSTTMKQSCISRVRLTPQEFQSSCPHFRSEELEKSRELCRIWRICFLKENKAPWIAASCFVTKCSFWFLGNDWVW